MLQLKTTGPFAGLKLIDADSHYTEPLDLWTSRAPAKLKDRVPQVRIADNGRPHWFIDGRQGAKDSGVSFVDVDGRKVAYYDADMLGGAPRGQVHPASYDAVERVKLLDEMGIYAQIVYPNLLGFATPTLIQMLDRELSITIVQIYNDAVAEWQEQGRGRLYPQAVLPFWDIPASVAEAQRVKDLGLTGVTMAGEPHLGGLPDLGQPDWNPLYEVLEDLELPIDIHIGARNVELGADGPGASWPSLPERAGKPVRSVQIELANARSPTSWRATSSSGTRSCAGCRSSPASAGSPSCSSASTTSTARSSKGWGHPSCRRPRRCSRRACTARSGSRTPAPPS